MWLFLWTLGNLFCNIYFCLGEVTKYDLLLSIMLQKSKGVSQLISSCALHWRVLCIACQSARYLVFYAQKLYVQWPYKSWNHAGVYVYMFMCTFASFAITFIGREQNFQSCLSNWASEGKGKRCVWDYWRARKQDSDLEEGESFRFLVLRSLGVPKMSPYLGLGRQWLTWHTLISLCATPWRSL